MRILVLSFYYQPDLCAGSFRTTALIEELKKNEDCSADIITTLPNRYASFSKEAKKLEVDGNMTIHRVALPSHKSGMADQIRAFVTYYKEASKIAACGDYDFVYATSSRLFTAFLGARLATKMRLPLYLDIRDIFVDTIKDVLPSKIALFAKPFFTLVEKYTFRRAQRINLVSKGFEHYFSLRFPKTEYRWFTNGIDKEFLELGALPSKSQQVGSVDASEHLQAKILNVVYAGNIGEGQGLHIILPKLAKALEGQFVFHVIGDGGRKSQLENAISATGVNNLKLLPPVNRSELIAYYKSADILFLHLNDYPAFKKVLPSKIFEYAAMRKPIWAGVSGYAAEFLNAEVDNSGVFEPGNHQQAIQVLQSIKFELSQRNDFVTAFSRKNIMSKMATDLAEFTLGKHIL